MDEQAVLTEETGIVKKIQGPNVWVEMIPHGGCAACSLHGVCGAKDQKILHKICTELTLNIGDKVQLNIAPAKKIFSSFIIFIFPLLMMVGAYYLARLYLLFTEGYSIIVSVASLALSALIVWLIDKQFAKQIVFKIVQKIN